MLFYTEANRMLFAPFLAYLKEALSRKFYRLQTVAFFCRGFYYQSNLFFASILFNLKHK